ncbi:MAG: hypothetical protein KF845_11605 [Cyclobacteriaceae bacterium]|nr:hypothetical protein [Cyclobacteriaceae bacterium]
MLSKQQIYQKCEVILTERIERIQQEIALVQASANEETKSSAGDKYETGRAMAQLEVERNRQQLIEAEKLFNRLHEFQHVQVGRQVVPGALVNTSAGSFYIGVSLGQIELNEQHCFCVSPEAPIAKALMGLTAGDETNFNGKPIRVLEVS